MKTIKVGMFPGRLEDYIVSEGATVADLLSLAGITVADDMEVKLDSETVGLNDVANGSVLVVTKKLKGN